MGGPFPGQNNYLDAEPDSPPSQVELSASINMAPSRRASAQLAHPNLGQTADTARAEQETSIYQKCDKYCILHAPLFLSEHTHTFALACTHTSQDDSYNCRDRKFTKSPAERRRTRGDGLGIPSTRHSRAKVSSPLCPTRTKPGSVTPPRPASSLSPRERRGVAGRRCQARTLTFRAPRRADTRR